MAVLTDYVEHALAQAIFDKLEDGTFSGRIPSCMGVIAFGASLKECEQLLRSTLEDWILLGLKMQHPLPVIGGIDLNREPVREPLMECGGLPPPWIGRSLLRPAAASRGQSKAAASRRTP